MGSWKALDDGNVYCSFQWLLFLHTDFVTRECQQERKPVIDDGDLFTLLDIGVQSIHADGMTLCRRTKKSYKDRTCRRWIHYFRVAGVAVVDLNPSDSLGSNSSFLRTMFLAKIKETACTWSSDVVRPFCCDSRFPVLCTIENHLRANTRQFFKKNI